MNSGSKGGALQVLQRRWLYQEIRGLSSGMAAKNCHRLFIYMSNGKECNYPLTPGKVHQEKNQPGQRDENRQLVVKNLQERAQKREE